MSHPLALLAGLAVAIASSPVSAREPAAAKAVKPNDPAYRAFDFWVGDWDVTNKAGENKIEKLLNGFLLLENWTSIGGGSGKSINHYDRDIRKWRQIWVDPSGGVIDAVGGWGEAPWLPTKRSPRGAPCAASASIGDSSRQCTSPPTRSSRLRRSPPKHRPARRDRRL